MKTVKFGSSEVEFKLAQGILYGKDSTILIAILADGVDFATLQKELAGYGGTVTEYEDSTPISEFKGYEESPSIYSTHYDIDNAATAVYQIELRKVTEKDIESINSSLNSMALKSDQIEKSVATNTEDVTSALESIASLFEMVTAVAPAEDTSVEASSESESTSESEA